DAIGGDFDDVGESGGLQLRISHQAGSVGVRGAATHGGVGGCRGAVCVGGDLIVCACHAVFELGDIGYRLLATIKHFAVELKLIVDALEIRFGIGAGCAQRGLFE